MMKISIGESFVLNGKNIEDKSLKYWYKDQAIWSCWKTSDDKGFFIGYNGGIWYSLNVNMIRKVEHISGFRYIDSGEIVIKSN